MEAVFLSLASADPDASVPVQSGDAATVTFTDPAYPVTRPT